MRYLAFIVVFVYLAVICDYAYQSMKDFAEAQNRIESEMKQQKALSEDQN